MNAKKAARNILLVLAIGSVAYVAVKELVDRRKAISDVLAAGSQSAEITPKTKLVVYYFGEGKNCTTCERIPMYTRQALDKYFENEMATGAIVWMPVNVDEARNEHFVSDYHIYTKSIVLVRLENGKQIRWENLEDVWDLVYKGPQFIEYIRKETRAMLDSAT